MVLAALTPRLTGAVEMGLTGFKMELVKLSKVGRLAGYSEEDILAAIEAKLKEQELASLATRSVADAARNAARARHRNFHEDDYSQHCPPLAGPSLRDVESEYNEPIWRLRTVLTSVPRDSPEYASALTQLAALLELKSFEFGLGELASDETVAFVSQLEAARRQQASCSLMFFYDSRRWHEWFGTIGPYASTSIRNGHSVTGLMFRQMMSP
jgi:hypothetical protein